MTSDSGWWFRSWCLTTYSSFTNMVKMDIYGHPLSRVVAGGFLSFTLHPFGYLNEAVLLAFSEWLQKAEPRPWRIASMVRQRSAPIKLLGWIGESPSGFPIGMCSWCPIDAVSEALESTLRVEQGLNNYLKAPGRLILSILRLDRWSKILGHQELKGW